MEKTCKRFKIRIGLRMVNAEPTKAQQIIEEASANTFTGIADEAKFPYLSLAPDRFPLNDDDGRTLRTAILYRLPW